MIYLRPHVYLTRENALTQDYILRIAIPLEFAFNVSEPQITNSGIARSVDIDFTAQGAPSISIHIVDVPIYRPPNEKFIEINCFKDSFPTGTSKVWYDNSDNKPISNFRPLIYVTRSSVSGPYKAYGLINLLSGYSEGIIHNCGINSAGSRDVGLIIESDPASNRTTPLSYFDYFAIPDDKAIEVCSDFGGKKGKTIIKQEDADDKPYFSSLS